MVHDLSPYIFKITEHFGPRWYGFSYLLGFVLAYFIISWLGRRQQTDMTPDKVSDFIMYCAIGTLVGGRLGYCVFYDPELFWSFSSQIPFWKVLAVNEGGMASHGGIIGVIVACWLFGRKHHINWVYLLDLVAIAGPVGIFCGRIANFINGELVGRIAPPDFKYGMKFPTDILNWPGYEPHRLESLAPVVEKLQVPAQKWTELITQYRTDLNARDELFSIINRVIEGIQNGNGELKAAIAPILDYRYPSQLLAALTEGVITFAVLFFLARKARRPGYIAGSFVICYAVMRIVNEMYRMPDAHLGFQLFGLTRGQWLSIGMGVVGLVLIVYWSQTQSQIIHGWKTGENLKLSKRNPRA